MSVLLLVEELTKSKNVKASYDDVSLIFSNKYSNELFDLYIEMYNDKFTTWREPNESISSKKELEEELKSTLERKIKTPGAIPLMHIMYKGKFVGFSFPRKCSSEVDLAQFKITINENYHKIGNFIVSSKYRGLGIGSIAAMKFKEKYPKLVYTPDPDNHQSIKVAINLGLTNTHNLYYPVKHWSFTPNSFGSYEMLVYKN